MVANVKAALRANAFSKAATVEHTQHYMQVCEQLAADPTMRCAYHGHALSGLEGNTSRNSPKRLQSTVFAASRTPAGLGPTTCGFEAKTGWDFACPHCGKPLHDWENQPYGSINPPLPQGHHVRGPRWETHSGAVLVAERDEGQRHHWVDGGLCGPS